MPKEEGYRRGLKPALELYRLCKKAGIKEMTAYGFTQDNTKRPKVQVEAFQQALIGAAEILAREDAELLVVGDTDTPLFPLELLPYTKRVIFGRGGIKVNFLVNYDWEWDLKGAVADTKTAPKNKSTVLIDRIRSKEISRLDLVIRWGGRNRLSGFLPVQSVYADFYVVDDYWPDFKPEHFWEALEWYGRQDITLGG